MISLQELCIKAIAKKFRRFYFAYRVTNDEILKKIFEGVQRKCTYELGSELLKRGKMKNRHVDFLINEYLHCLEGKWVDSMDLYPVEAIICRLPNLTKVSLNEMCNDEILKQIAKFCPNIIEINASNGAVTDIGIKYLYENVKGKIPCPKLKRLSIDSSSVTDEGIARLIQNLPSIEKLDHKNVPLILHSIHKGDLSDLENVRKYNFHHLNLLSIETQRFSHIPFYTELLYVCLTVCPELESLECSIKNEEQLNLLKNTNLKELCLYSDRRFPKIDINYFLKSKGLNLSIFKFSNCKVSLNTFGFSCPNLTKIHMSNVIFTDDPVYRQSTFHSLLQCTFEHTAFDNICNKALDLILSSSPKLERLVIKYCDLSRDTKLHILTCCESNRLKEIVFSAVEFRFIKLVLQKSTSLKILRLFNISFKRRELIQILQMLPNKPRVYIDGLHIDIYDAYY